MPIGLEWEILISNESPYFSYYPCNILVLKDTDENVVNYRKRCGYMPLFPISHNISACNFNATSIGGGGHSLVRIGLGLGLGLG